MISGDFDKELVKKIVYDYLSENLELSVNNISSEEGKCTIEVKLTLNLVPKTKRIKGGLKIFSDTCST